MGKKELSAHEQWLADMEEVRQLEEEQAMLDAIEDDRNQKEAQQEYLDSIKTTVKDTIKEVMREVKKEDEKKEKDTTNDILYNIPGSINLGLDENNFIMKYIQYASRLTDAYLEYHYATALSILSTITKRKVVCKLSIGTIYPNTWIWALGLSTYAKKSTAMKMGEDILDDCNITNRMPEYYSPEGLIEFLDTNSKGHLWIDEAGQMLANFQKAYMEEMKDMMCKLYDNKGFSKKLRTSKSKDKQTEFYVTSPYISQFLMTTPETFKSRTSLLDITSGWLLRYLYFSPEYKKDWKGARILDNFDIVNRREIKNSINAKIRFIDSVKNEILFRIEPKGLDYWNDWQEKKYNELGKSNDEYTGALLGRLQIYVIKLAMLFEIGENSYEIIRLESIKEACKQVDEYFLPVARSLVDDIGMNEDKNLFDKVTGTLKRSGNKVYWSELLRRCKVDKDRLKSTLETMEEAGMVKWDKKHNLIELMKLK